MHPPFRFHKHERGPPGTAVLCAERPAAGGRDARRQGVQCGDALQFPDLPSLKSESAIRQAVGFLKTAKHIIKDGKDQMAPLIESDENRDLYRTLAAEIREIAADDEAETVAG